LSQRVCHLFREITSSSQRIQRALFFEPAHYIGNLEAWKLLKWNPFLETKLSDLLAIRVRGIHRSAEGPVKLIAHTRFKDNSLKDHQIARIFPYKGASWKRMFVTIPLPPF
jgi:hypothetical protein